MTILPRIQTFEEFESETLAMLKPAFKSRYGMLTWADLDKPGAEMEWLIDDLLTVGDKSIIGGPSQSGKSFLAIEAGMCIALGKPFLGHEVRKGLVIYQAGEGARGVKNRLRAYRKHFGIDPQADVPFVLLQNRVDLFSPEGDTQPLIEEIQAIRGMYSEPLRAIFIDTLAKAQGMADENKGVDMARVLDNIDRIREVTGVAICLVHHLNADGTKLRGHTSVYANLDQVLSVTADEDTKVRSLKTAKMKDGADDLIIKFKLEVVDLGVDQRGKRITSCVVRSTTPEKVGDDVEFENAFAPKYNDREFLNALFLALERHGERPPPGIEEIPNTVSRVVDWKAFRETYIATSIKSDADPEKEKARMRKAVERSGRYLREARVIGVHDHCLWWTGRVVHGIPQTYPKRKPPTAAAERTPDDDLPFA